MQSDLAAASPQPATYDQLKTLRSQFAGLFFSVLVLSWCLGGITRVLTVSPEETSASANQVDEPSVSDNSRTALLLLGFVPGIVVAGLTFVYAQKIGMPNPLAIMLLMLIPVINWIAFFMMVGYVPPHLKEFEPAYKPTSLLWLVIGLLPFILMALLMFLNPRYMSQLFLGPPVGAYIPGLPIPCGWAILALILITVGLINLPLWLGFQKGLVRGGWQLLLVILVCIYFLFPSLYLVILGPAAVQVFIFMQGG